MTTSVHDLHGRRIYLDANVIVYFLDGTTGHSATAARLLSAAAEGLCRAVTSDAAVAEVMVGPYRSGDQEVIRAVRAFFNQPRLLEVVGHSVTVFDDAAMLRASQGMPFIDALHVATAAGSGCDVVVTDDRRMRPALGVEIVPLRSIAS